MTLTPLALKITDYLAIYAALLSTAVFVWNFLQSRPRIKVDLIFGIESSDGKIESGIYVIVRNLSSHEVHLANISILYPYTPVTLKTRIAHLWRFKRWPRRIGWVHSSLSEFLVESGCPACLEARKSHQVFVPKPIVERILSEATEGCLIARVQDQLWNNIYSRKFKWLASGRA